MLIPSINCSANRGQKKPQARSGCRVLLPKLVNLEEVLG